MIAAALSCAIRGLAGVPVTVEADVANGLPNFTIVGLTDRAIQEARERVRAAIRNGGLEWPQRRITVNLAPAEVHKEGTCFDLAIAIAVLRAGDSGIRSERTAFIAELSLDAAVRPVTGVLPMARCLAAAGVRTLIVAEENGEEASLVEGLCVLPVGSLPRCVEHLRGESPLSPAQPSQMQTPIRNGADLAGVRGQARAKRALEIATAGGHNVLMTGPPGAGKTMLARTVPSLLPDLSQEEALDVAALYSLRGALRERPATAMLPPFRAPHHSVSRAGLIGGGSGFALPGEISLAHRGVLFLDELCEFPASHLEALRQPLEERTVTVVRAKASVTYPADFMLVAAANPCPCGHLGDVRGCTCDTLRLTRYQAKMSGPIKDRIDLSVSVPRLRYEEIFAANDEEQSATVRTRVAAARERQLQRLGKLNAALSGAEARAACALDRAASRLLARSGERMHLSARAFFRVLRVARTIADLAGVERVDEDTLAEALSHRAGAGA